MNTTQRHFIQLSYNGANYAGWQIQKNATSVQETLNKALSILLREEIYCVGAGRTDTGVHAAEMFAHFDAAGQINATDLVYRLNKFLPEDIAIDEIFEVNPDAHARFSATSRSYQYYITTKKSPFKNKTTWFMPLALDVEAMNFAAKQLLGEHDFGAFARSNTQTKTNICNVTEAFWQVQGDMLVFNVSANRFLRNMVRAVVGTLVDVGQNKLSIDGFSAVMNSQNRAEAGSSAPAHGLYLTRVLYPENILKNG
jgi:tRNA pseudouridine38-40 synthase